MSLFPQAIIVAVIFTVLALGLLRRPPAFAIKILGVFAVLAALWSLSLTPLGGAAPLIDVDLKSLAWQIAIYIGALPLAFMLSGDDVETALFLGCVLGMGIISTAANLPMLFVGLEFMSLPAYLLLARVSGESAAGGRARRLEAAVKYFFAGALAGAIFLMGASLYYAETRSLAPVNFALGPRGQVGVALMAAAALFKVGAVPWHWWLPDVYEAAAPEVAGFLSTSMKSAAVLFLMRVVGLSPHPSAAAILPAIGALTAFVGAVLALRQTSLARLLAYSSLSHAGLLILGVGAWSALGRSSAAAASLAIYAGAYAFMSNGAFALLNASGARTRSDLSQLSARSPYIAAAAAALFLSLAGIPPTGGFLAKLLVFWQSLRAGLVVDAVIAALAAVVSLGYYLGLVNDMYFTTENAAVPASGPADRSTARWILGTCAFASIAAGAAPVFLKQLLWQVWK